MLWNVAGQPSDSVGKLAAYLLGRVSTGSSGPAVIQSDGRVSKSTANKQPAAAVAAVANGHATATGSKMQEAEEAEQGEEESDAALAHLRTTAALLEQYYHPSNLGSCAFFLSLYEKLLTPDNLNCQSSRRPSCDITH